VWGLNYAIVKPFVITNKPYPVYQLDRKPQVVSAKGKGNNIHQRILINNSILIKQKFSHPATSPLQLAITNFNLPPTKIAVNNTKQDLSHTSNQLYLSRPTIDLNVIEISTQSDQKPSDQIFTFYAKIFNDIKEFEDNHTKNTLQFQGLDFTDQESIITIDINPSTSKNSDFIRPIHLEFIPGDQCRYIDDRACIYSYLTPSNNIVIFITLHSGLGGDGQPLRHAFEGTGFNRAGYSIKKVMSNLDKIVESHVTIQQGTKLVNSLEVTSAGRIHARYLEKYFSTPIEDLAGFANSIDSGFQSEITLDRPTIIIETCGWRMRGEEWAPGITQSTGSIYLLIIQ
jgi:hypothetical protein